MKSMKSIPKLETIGDVAQRFDITARTLRYYEEIGLITPAHRLQGQKRAYDERHMEELHTILELKSLGFSLAQISEVLSLFRTHQTDGLNRIRMQSSVNHLIREIDKKSLQLDVLRHRLLKLGSALYYNDLKKAT